MFSKKLDRSGALLLTVRGRRALGGEIFRLCLETHCAGANAGLRILFGGVPWGRETAAPKAFVPSHRAGVNSAPHVVMLYCGGS